MSVRLETLFERLSFYKVSSVSRTPAEFANTILDLPISQQEPATGYSVMPRISTEVLERMARNAVRGNRDDMLTISMCYGVGLGLPKNDRLSLAWASMSLVEADKEVAFLEAVQLLKKHVRELPDSGWAYPSIINRIYDKCLHQAQRADLSILKHKSCYSIGPIIAGLRVSLIYRIEGPTCYLYSARVGGKSGELTELDTICRLNIPVKFGNIRGSDTIPNYCERMADYVRGPVKAFVVSGTIAVPNDKKSLVKENFPECTSVYDLFREFAKSMDEPRKEFRHSEEYNALMRKLTKYSEIESDLESGKAMDDLKRRWNKLKRTHDKHKTKSPNDIKIREECLATLSKLKELRSSIENGKRLKSLRSKMEALKVEIAEAEQNEQHDKEVFSAKYLENVFQFIASDIYAFDDDGYYEMPLARHLHTHLQGLGFTSFNHPAIDQYKTLMKKAGSVVTDTMYTNAVDKFQAAYPEFDVKGISAKEINTDNEPTIYLISL